VNSSPLSTWLNYIALKASGSVGLLGDLDRRNLKAPVSWDLGDVEKSLISKMAISLLRECHRRMAGMDVSIHAFDNWAFSPERDGGERGPHTQVYRHAIWPRLEQLRTDLKKGLATLERLSRVLCPGVDLGAMSHARVEPTGIAPFLGMDGLKAFEELLLFRQSLPDIPNFEKSKPLEEMAKRQRIEGDTSVHGQHRFPPLSIRKPK
jgi:hypothetical protein